MRKSIVTAVFILVFAGCISESVYAGIPADERNALIDLYNNTKYLGWTDSTNWLGTAGTECTWYGINCDDSETSVTGIILINNNLAGNIPESIENFMNLKRLNLSYNQLTGNIPESIGNLTNLKRLNLSYNQLTGNIPESIGNFTNLITINLSYNQLTGTIPNSVINLVNLQVADVGLNNLTGNIPLELGYLTNLTHLYLHYNDLDGNIPPELGNLINLELLRLGHNRLTGNIPPELGNLANLTMLTFESNQLTGEIPIQLGELYNLENGKNGFRWNALYASDDNLSIFLNTKQSGGNWESSQTVTPDYLEAIITDDENFTPISVPLAWSPSPLPSINDAESGYSISYSTTSGAYTQSVTVTGNDTEYAVVSGLTPDTTYYFALRSFTGPHTNNGNIVYSEYTDEVSAATPVAYPPIVTTALISETSASEAAGGGEVTDYGYSAITARGVCWNTSANPDITDNYLGITDDNTNAFSGDFTSKLTGLTPVTQYFVKAYAVNGKGTSYGKEVEFTTPPDVPSVVTEEVTSVTSYTAESGGEVISDGGAPVTAKGVCWSTLFIDNSIELEDLYHTEDGSGTGSFTSSISDLEPGKLYFLRSYAVNSAGTAYGNQFFFDTPAVKPTVETADAASVTETGVSAGGTVTSDGGATVTARGLCWSTSVIDDTTKLEEIDHTEDGSGTGSFTSSITGLNPNTTYHIRAYATNIKGTSFGSDKSFKTKTDNPKVETGSAGNVTATEASCSGNVVSDGGAPVTARGVCWSVYENPTIEDAYTADGSGTGNFTSSITGLTPDTTYYVRAYASNIEKTGYGNQVTFKTDPVVPSVTTEKASSVSKTGALSGGNVVSDGGTPVTARGVCWSVYENPTIKDAYISGGSGTGSFTSSISGLNSGTTYYIRAYATNSRGTAYGQNESFTTKSGMPELTTSAVPESAVTETSASCGGKIISDGGYPVTARGVCWNTAEAPTIEDNYTTSGSGTGEFESLISGLTPMTTYYTRAYATNSQGTAYGQNESFATEGARPSVSTDGAVALSLHSASFFGNISSDGGTDVTERGFCWNTSGFPTLGANSNKISSGDGTGSFTAEVSGLDSGMLYYVRAYAINDIGTGYGNQLFFYTPAPAKPKVDTVAAFDITPGAALCGGEVIHNGGYSVTARGVCWNTSDVPDTAEPADFDHTTDGTGTGSFTSSISGLTPDTTYYTRAYATSSEGTGYGEQLFFHTPALAKPQVTTAPVTDITPTAVSCGGEVISDGWLPVSARGVCWSTSDNPETDNNDGITSQGTGTGSFTSSITGLSPDTIYYVRAYAVNSLGTAYGKQESFSTDTTPPTVISTSPADNATDMALNAVITAVFSEPVDITTVTSSAFYISDGSGNIPGTITYSDNSVTLTPDAYVDIGPTYTATITTRVTDLAGNPLNADYTWSFSYDKDKEWNWQNPLPTGNTIREIWGSAETGIFAAGDAGTVLWQDGSGWKEMKTSTYKNLRGIWGSSDSNIFAVGEAGRIINYNGEEWVVASSHTSDNLNGIWGSSDSDIFAVGQEGTILHFDGIEWTGVTSITDNDLFDVWGRTDSDVFAAGSAGTILYYNGTEWIGLDSGVTENLYSIWGHSGSDVYAVGHAGTILNYDGNEWIELDSGVSENLYNVWGSGSDVYVAGHAGTILHYDGTVWKKMETGITLNLYGIRASSDSDVYAVGQFGTILHYGGTGWSKTNTGTTARLRHVWGTSAESDLIAAGNAGMILRYNGTDWKKEPGNMSENLNCVWGSSDSDIFVVGESGVILHNNGTEWKEQLGNISENLNSVWGNSDSDVYAVGDIGTILHFDGAEWIQTDSSVTENLYGIWGSSESDIFAVGQAGIILHFDGAEWIQTDSGVTENLYDIWGSSETDVFAVGHAGTILHYDGTEWTQTDSSISENLYSIWGSSETDVFAAGHSGTILHCDGTEWKWMKSGTFNFLEGIWGSSGSDVYAVGQSGTILHYDAELPFVDSTSPENNSTGISSETEPAATFSEPMKKSSFTSETFFLLSDDSDDKIKGTVQYDEEGMTVKFIPEQGLAEDKTYTAIITADVADLAGNPMEAEFTWSFITGPVPVIISTVPANDGVSASLHTDITAVFSEPVKVSSLTTETFTLYDGSDKAVEGTVQYDEEGMTVKFIQEQGLAEDKTYTAIITADVADLAGNPLGTEFTWSFTTGPAPVIISTVPANGGVGASLNTDITAVFSEPVKVSSLTNETFTVYDDSDRIVDGTVDYDEENMAAIFKPTVSLNYKTIYHAAITVDITDMAGNPLKADYNWSFTTANYNVPPPLTNPENGETEVPADTEFITAVFTEQMNKSTLTNDTFYITYNSGVKAEGTVDYDEESMTAIFIPAHSLNYNTMYNATITTGFTNIAGDSMANNYTWSFTTGDDNKRPAIVSVFPANNAVDISLSPEVIVTFSEPVIPASITNESFFVSDNSGAELSGTVNYDNTKTSATLTLAQSLNYNTAYTVTVTGDVTDLAGNTMGNEYVWTFKTELDTVPPKVVSKFPADGAPNVYVYTKVTATFSEGMEPSNITTDSFLLYNGSVNIPGTVEYAGKTATFIPGGDYTPYTTYTAVITSVVTDLAGNHMKENCKWLFTTGKDTKPPVVIKTSPENNAVDVAVNTVYITATFSEDMEPSAFTNATFFITGGTHYLFGTVSCEGDTAVLKLSKNLAPLTTYTVAINTYVTDTAGNRMEKDYEWSFKTGLDNIAPRVIATNPYNQAVKVPVEQEIRAAFSEPVDSQTVTIATFFVFDSSGNNVKGTVNYDEESMTATFKPINNFDYNTTYTVTVNTVVRDVAGNRLESDHTWSFTTLPEPPRVSATNPENSAVNIPVDAVLSAWFSNSMLSESLTKATFFVFDSSGNNVEGTVNYIEANKTA
ncbi:MAG: hypothetical protein GY749_48240, partial [Desulfobacteraceae bacterium]|nr:hypothetical protein [Desulfobacteraceae bacterium]